MHERSSNKRKPLRLDRMPNFLLLPMRLCRAGEHRVTKNTTTSNSKQNHQARVNRQMDDLLIHQEKIREKIELCKKGGELTGS